MKRTLSLLLCLALGAATTFGQTNAAKTVAHPVKIDDTTARQATEQLTAKYSLNADQAKQMYGIQIRKLRNLAEIERLRTENPALFRAKLESIQRNTIAAIRRILRTKAQVGIFKKTQDEVRLLRAARRKELAQKGATKEAADAALLEIYAE